MKAMDYADALCNGADKATLVARREACISLGAQAQKLLDLLCAKNAPQKVLDTYYASVKRNAVAAEQLAIAIRFA